MEVIINHLSKTFFSIKILFLTAFLASWGYSQNICEHASSSDAKIYSDFAESNDLIDYLSSSKAKTIKDTILKIYNEYREVAYTSGHLKHCDTTSQKLNKFLQDETTLQANLLFYHPNGEVEETQIFHVVVTVKYNNKNYIIDMTHDQFFCSNEGVLIAEEVNYNPRINEIGYARRSKIIKNAPRSTYSDIKY
ncbi:MAG TPA: hypothetical protein PKC21_01220 [Oligoflexia bacterium]|nr:hypothetical protein [Oligoflexia bacterium]HMR23950.1 hypothetical protein [Oligoflexia bacterium]